MRHLQIALAPLLLASGCATEPVSSSTAPQSTDVLDAAVVTPRAGAGQIVVTRATGALVETPDAPLGLSGWQIEVTGLDGNFTALVKAPMTSALG